MRRLPARAVPRAARGIWDGAEDDGRGFGVFLLDDHEVVTAGLRALLEGGADIDVVVEAGTVADALVRIPAAKPDVAILDVRWPDGSGIGSAARFDPGHR